MGASMLAPRTPKAASTDTCIGSELGYLGLMDPLGYLLGDACLHGVVQRNHKKKNWQLYSRHQVKPAPIPPRHRNGKANLQFD